jgi:hypothetical protein
MPKFRTYDVRTNEFAVEQAKIRQNREKNLKNFSPYPRVAMTENSIGNCSKVKKCGFHA